MELATGTPRVVIAGGSGFLGISLARHLAEQDVAVVILSRHKTVPGPWEFVSWDGRSTGDWVACLEGATALVNLAGRSVNCIKSPDHQDEILRSRVESTRVLGRAVRSLNAPPPTWIQMSTAHIYGDPPSERCDEESALGCGFAPFIGRAWEAAFNEAVLPQQRAVILRTSFVVGRDQGGGGGALATLGWLARLGLGGRVGSGTQGMSWLHEQDFHGLVDWALAQPTVRGIYNASSPNPVSQVEFMRTLRRVLRMPIGLPATEWMVRFGAPVLLRTDPELALYGRYIISRRLEAEGFQFRYANLEPALREALAKRP